MTTGNYIKPGERITDTEGKLVQAHGAGMFYEDGTYKKPKSMSAG